MTLYRVDDLSKVERQWTMPARMTDYDIGPDSVGPYSRILGVYVGQTAWVVTEQNDLAGPSHIEVWDLLSGTKRRDLDRGITAAAFSGDGQLLMLRGASAFWTRTPAQSPSRLHVLQYAIGQSGAKHDIVVGC